MESLTIEGKLVRSEENANPVIPNRRNVNVSATENDLDSEVLDGPLAVGTPISQFSSLDWYPATPLSNGRSKIGQSCPRHCGARSIQRAQSGMTKNRKDDKPSIRLAIVWHCTSVEITCASDRGSISPHAPDRL